MVLRYALMRIKCKWVSVALYVCMRICMCLCVRQETRDTKKNVRNRAEGTERERARMQKEEDGKSLKSSMNIKIVTK